MTTSRARVRTRRDDPDVVHVTGPTLPGGPARGRSGRFGFLADDDPDFQRVVTQHALATGRDPQAELGREAALRDTHGQAGSLEEWRAAERAKLTPEPAPAPRARPANPSPPGPGPRLAGDGSGFLLGVLGYALLVNYLRYGPDGVKAWLLAKFLNRTDLGQRLVTSTTPPPAAAGGGGGRAVPTSARTA